MHQHIQKEINVNFHDHCDGCNDTPYPGTDMEKDKRISNMSFMIIKIQSKI